MKIILLITIDAYLYDGHGSVAQLHGGADVADNYTYSPYGEVITGGNANDVAFGYNGEKYKKTIHKNIGRIGA